MSESSQELPGDSHELPGDRHELPGESHELPGDPDDAAAAPEGLWRVGDTVVARRDAKFPQTCIVTGASTFGREISWTFHRPNAERAYLLLLLFSCALPCLLPCVILFGILVVASEVTEMEFRLPVAASWSARRRRRGWLGLIFLICALVAVSALYSSSHLLHEMTSHPLTFAAMTLPPTALAGLACVVLSLSQILRVRALSANAIWWSGAAPEFVELLPELEPTGAWRSGETLIIARGAQLPEYCLKTNQPTYGNSLRVGRFDFPVSGEWLAKRRQYYILGWTLVVTALFLLFFAVDDVARRRGEFSLVWFGLALVIAVSGVLILVQMRLVSIVSASDDMLWVRGAHPEFLQRFPEL